MIFGVKVIKFLLFLFNFIFAIFGIAILSLGIVYKLRLESIVKYLGNDFPIAPDLFIAIGTIAFVISFFGCVGASRENRPMLIAFVILLVVLLVIELAVVIIAFVGISNGNLEKNIENIIDVEIERNRIGIIEKELECCGKLGPNSYLPNDIPSTCYRDGVHKDKNLFNDGCLRKIKELFHTVGKQLGAIAITVALIEILGALFALTLSGTIQKQIC